MSSLVTQNVSDAAPVVAAETKAHKSTLPEKYGKFLQFAYYMMDNILGDEFEMDKDAYIEKINLFGSVEDQQNMVQGFLDAAKENKKTIRKVIADRKKAIANANKPPRKPRAKKAAPVVSEEDGASTSTTPAKKSRKKAATKEINNVQDELLNDLVQLARDDAPAA